MTTTDSPKKGDSDTAPPSEHSLEFYRIKYIEALEGRVGLHEEITARDNEIREKDKTIRTLRSRVAELEEALESGSAMSIDTVEQPAPVAKASSSSNKAAARSSGNSSSNNKKAAAKSAPAQKASPTGAASKSRRVSVSEKAAASAAVAEIESEEKPKSSSSMDSQCHLFKKHLN